MVGLKKYTLKLGFSLAEVLITLGIIGVVAAMTIPALISNIQDAQLKTAWKKTFSTFSNATSSIMQDNAWNISSLITSSNDTIRVLYEPYLRINKSCASPTANGVCWHPDSGWQLLNKSAIPTSVTGISYLSITSGPAADILSDGTFARYIAVPCSGNTYCGHIIVDVNGFKPPNIVGKDIFGMFLYPDKLVPFGIPSRGEESTCTATDQGFGCSAYYLSN